MAWLLGYLGCGKQSRMNRKYRKGSKDNTSISTHPKAKLLEIPGQDRIQLVIPQPTTPHKIILVDLEVYLHLHQSLRSPHPSSSRDHPREGDPPHRMEGGGKGGGSWHSEINFLCVSFYGTKGIKKNF